jgi:hypothetical protein
MARDIDHETLADALPRETGTRRARDQRDLMLSSEAYDRRAVVTVAGPHGGEGKFLVERGIDRIEHAGHGIGLHLAIDLYRQFGPQRALIASVRRSKSKFLHASRIATGDSFTAKWHRLPRQ